MKNNKKTKRTSIIDKKALLRVKKIPKSVKSGFTIVESLVAVFIFSLTAVMLSGVFSSLLKNYMTAKRIQRSTESAQYAMNLMAKTIRTSAVKSVSLSKMRIFDYSQSINNCIEFEYDNANNKITTAYSTADDVSYCDATTSLPILGDLTKKGDIVSMAFNRKFGTNVEKVTIVVGIPGNDPVNPLNNTFKIQTTTSLRQ